MVIVEKLTVLNVDSLRNIYNKYNDSYLCDKDFFEIYDNESFLVKFLIRKQMKLLKINNEYIGYVWHEYPLTSNCTRIYAFYVNPNYLNVINREMLDTINKSKFIFDIRMSQINNILMDKLNFYLTNEITLMKAKLDNANYKASRYFEDFNFKHFKCNKDELLRCETQNSIFKNKNRVSLTVDDVLDEEKENYFIEDLCIFIYHENTVLGYGQVILYKGNYTIVNFGIIEEYRNNGCGEILLTYLLTLCRNNAIEEVYIRVEKNNLPAVSLYSKIGFSDYIDYGTYINDFNVRLEV